MPVYSEVIDDAEIVKIVNTNEFKNVLIIGCSGCMNESLAIKNKVPLNIVKNGQRVSYAISAELTRLSHLLKSCGCTVYCQCVPEGSNALCMIDRSRELYNYNECKASIEAVFALCCPGGIIGLKFENTAIPVIPLTRTKGVLGYFSETSHNGTRTIVFDGSKIIKINFNE